MIQHNINNNYKHMFI